MARETLVEDGGQALPYSKGLMAQQLSASGIEPPRAYELAAVIEQRLAHAGDARIDAGALGSLAERVLAQEEGKDALERYRRWRRIDRLDRPLIVLLAGTTGVGKSTLASQLAGRLGITRVIATDAIRQVLRSFFSHEFMPTVHFSAFEAGGAVDAPARDASGPEVDVDLLGFAQQAEIVGTGVGAIVERACDEGTPMVVEGVHLLPGSLDPGLRERCVAVEAVVTVDDEERHRAHLGGRAGGRGSSDRYLARFEQIRKLQSYLAARAREEGVVVIENTSLDDALATVMELVLDAAGRVPSSDAG